MYLWIALRGCWLFGQVGDLLVDIHDCKAQANAIAAPAAAPAGASPGSITAAAVAPLGPQLAARQLGLHYLKRYFLLIAYRWVGA